MGQKKTPPGFIKKNKRLVRLKKKQIARRKNESDPLLKEKFFTHSERKRIYGVFKLGFPQSRVAGIAGVSNKLLQKILLNGTNEEERLHYDFLLQIKRIQGRLEYESLKIIQDAAKGGQKIVEKKITTKKIRGIVKEEEIQTTTKTMLPAWKAAAWTLERKYKEYVVDKCAYVQDKTAEELAYEIQDITGRLFDSVPNEESETNVK